MPPQAVKAEVFSDYAVCPHRSLSSWKMKGDLKYSLTDIKMGRPLTPIETEDLLAMQTACFPFYGSPIGHLPDEEWTLGDCGDRVLHRLTGLRSKKILGQKPRYIRDYHETSNPPAGTPPQDMDWDDNAMKTFLLYHGFVVREVTGYMMTGADRRVLTPSHVLLVGIWTNSVKNQASWELWYRGQVWHSGEEPRILNPYSMLAHFPVSMFVLWHPRWGKDSLLPTVVKRLTAESRLWQRERCAPWKPRKAGVMKELFYG